MSDEHPIEAYEAGLLHGIDGRYDCRKFWRYEEFTHYGEGRAAGLLLLAEGKKTEVPSPGQMTLWK